VDTGQGSSVPTGAKKRKTFRRPQRTSLATTTQEPGNAPPLGFGSTWGIDTVLALDAGTTDAVPAGTVDDAPRSWVHGTSHAMDDAIGPTIHAISRALMAAECTS
jgi:hypothetical protein